MSLLSSITANAADSPPADTLLPQNAFPSGDPIDTRVLHEQITAIYHQATASASLGIAIAAGLCFMLRDVTASGLLTGWFALVATLFVVRISLIRAFLRRKVSPAEAPLWERRFVWSLLATCLVWGTGGWLIMPVHSPVHAVAVYCFLVGMSGGAVMSFSAHTRCAYITIFCMLTPATLWFLTLDDSVFRTIAIGGIAFAAMAWRTTSRFGFLLHRTFRLSHELHVAHENAQLLACIDDLSRMNNRRAFYDLGEAAFKRTQNRRTPLSLVMIDIDHFKRINDTWGHAAGDKAIRAVADAIGVDVRAGDITGRLGGEEFAIVLPGAGKHAAALLAERLREKMANLVIRHQGDDIRLTCSFGIAEQCAEMTALDALVHEADEALYKAKSEGRNRVVIADPVRLQTLRMGLVGFQARA